MFLLDINIQHRIIIGISAMALLFGSFLVALLTSQRKKLQYHKDLQALHEKQQQILQSQNALLEEKVRERTAELLKQKEALQQSLADLNITQSQLVHREKMASLGEITAGIAHEIQNPLNFVNNFAEINSELFGEIKTHLAKEDLSQKGKLAIDGLAKDITQNLEKIHEHGRRADAIVKNMMQHSRTSSGKKELTDINALCDEYLRLSYQAARVKDRSFNASLQTNFDPQIGSINVVSQDIGRVLLNLFSNAFFAVTEKKKWQLTGYLPMIAVQTILVKGKVEIHVKDNGTGISAKVEGKIFQPFFTTKAAGQGTGLGLSMSYDIVKTHSGEIAVATTPGEGTEFIVALPAR